VLRGKPPAANNICGCLAECRPRVRAPVFQRAKINGAEIELSSKGKTQLTAQVGVGVIPARICVTYLLLIKRNVS
jgi:hypothetical protein